MTWTEQSEQCRYLGRLPRNRFTDTTIRINITSYNFRHSLFNLGRHTV